MRSPSVSTSGPTRLGDHGPENVTISPAMREELHFMNSNTLDVVTRRNGHVVLRGEVHNKPAQVSPVHDTSSPQQAKPVLFVVDTDPVLRRALTAALKHR